MTAAFASSRHEETRAERLESLRRRMAEMSGRMSGAASGAAAPADLLGAESLLAMPRWLAESVRVPRGSVAVLSGARSLLLSMVAAVTAAGGNAAIVGQPDIGLLAAAEMGADLSRLAVIPDPGTDPVEVAAVLVDGMDLVVLGLGGRRVCGYEVTPAQWGKTAPGFGRISGVRLQVSGMCAGRRVAAQARAG